MRSVEWDYLEARKKPYAGIKIPLCDAATGVLIFEFEDFLEVHQMRKS